MRIRIYIILPDPEQTNENPVISSKTNKRMPNRVSEWSQTFESTPTFWLKFCYSNSSFVLQFKIIVDNFKYRYWYWYEVWHISYQCCGAGADRSRGFWVGAVADLKFNLEPEPIYWIGSGLFFLAREKRNDLKMFIFLSAVRSEVDWKKACAASSRILYITKCALLQAVFRRRRSRDFLGAAGAERNYNANFFTFSLLQPKANSALRLQKPGADPNENFFIYWLKPAYRPWSYLVCVNQNSSSTGISKTKGNFFIDLFWPQG